MFYVPVGLSNKLSCEAGSFSCHCLHPHRSFQSEVLRFYFPGLEAWVVRSVLLPVYLHSNVGPPALLATVLPRVLSPQLPIPAPPTSPDECFFCNSLVVRLPYSSIFCKFWLFFVFKFAVVFLLVVRGGTVCLPMPPSCNKPAFDQCPYFMSVRLSFIKNMYFVIQMTKIYFSYTVGLHPQTLANRSQNP